MAISLIRVDDRLIHGQVVMTWIRTIRCSQIKIIDDKTANDEFMCQLLHNVSPQGVALEIMEVSKAIAAYPEWETSPENVMIIVKTPIVLKEMAQAGIEFESINIGGIAITSGRKMFHRNIALSNDEKEFLLSQVKHGVDIYYQLTTSERRLPITEKMLR